MRGRPSQGASAVLKGAPLAPLRFLHAHSCLVASSCIEGSSSRPTIQRRTWHELRLLLVPVQGGKGAHPRQRRAEPVLPAWDEITALTQDSHPYHVGRLLPLPRRCRIDR